MERIRPPLTCSLPPLVDADRAGLDEIYAGLESNHRRAGASCRACGACCRLAEWGHELRVTPLELALFADRHVLRSPTVYDVCPYLAGDGRCAARAGRPLGCRAFHCSLPALQMEDAHARAFHDLRVLHEKRGIPFEQGDWLATLDYLSISC